MKKPTAHLPVELKNLVHFAVSALGEAIAKVHGQKVYREIENIRREMKSFRTKNLKLQYAILTKRHQKLSHFSSKDLFILTRSYSLMLELINTCENAYRCHRLDQKEIKIIPHREQKLIYVFTAHPTEARSPVLLKLFREINDCLGLVLQEGEETHKPRLHYLLSLLLRVPMARMGRPQVKEEAQNIYSFVLRDEILAEQIHYYKQGVTVHFRSWVGGDKDGHPFVNQTTMRASLGLSRRKLWRWGKRRLDHLKKTWENIEVAELKKIHKKLHDAYAPLAYLKDGDGKKIKKFRDILKTSRAELLHFFGTLPPEFDELWSMVWLYPALVIPLEVREDSELVHQSLKAPRMAIAQMLKALHKISEGFESKWYVRGFVLSMCQTSSDMQAGLKLVDLYLKKSPIPVVPLFENEQGLKNGQSILIETFKNHPKLIKQHHDLWHSRFEVMVGYSDSSKENGVFPGRLMIAECISKIDHLLRSHSLVPVFFHGSGGSVERGGGSVKEQTSWMPKSALDIYKVTIQGEMVARNFGYAQIMRSQIDKMVEQHENHKKIRPQSKIMSEFCDLVQEQYRLKVRDPEFQDMVSKVTPYHYLSHLKIGSRPTKRTTHGAAFSLRAIPWVLCWTQTRILFPHWWGVGHAWKALSPKQKIDFKKEYKHNLLLQSLMKALGLTLAKVELAVWMIYLERSGMEETTIKEVFWEFEAEYKKACLFFRELTGESNLLWARPWLGESIALRSPMIHPLNLVQIEALKRKDYALLRETVTGIACGMMTTG